MNFKEFTRWAPDDMPESTEAVVMSSDCGEVVKRLSYKKWNSLNKSYSTMKEHVYKQSSNRGKQRLEPEEKKIKHGRYKHVEIRGKVYSVHRIVALSHISNPNKKDCVNHMDGIRDNNNFQNLEWVSNKENVTHAWKTGLRCASALRKIPSEEIVNILEMKKRGLSNPEIGKTYNVTGEAIRYRVKQYNEQNSIHTKT